jgi:hypothetical protein
MLRRNSSFPASAGSFPLSQSSAAGTGTDPPPAASAIKEPRLSAPSARPGGASPSYVKKENKLTPMGGEGPGEAGLLA